MRPRNPYEVRDPAELRRRVKASTRVLPHSTRSLAEVTGFSQATIGHLLTGQKKRVTLELAQRFSAALGVPMDELFTPTMAASADDDNRGVEALERLAQNMRADGRADTPEEQ